LSILNLVEALIFGLFTAIMMWDQLSAIFENTTYIDSLQGKKGQKVCFIQLGERIPLPIMCVINM
jgi:hypothetical protein